jgi:hypothetical protein
LLKKRESLLPAQDKMYLKGLRQSYMSVFEVIDVKLDQTVTVRDLLEDKAPLQIVKEKQGTHYLCQWDLLGARLVKTPRGTFFAGGLLILNREAANVAQGIIHAISKVMMSKGNLRNFQKFTRDPVLMIKKMWVKEIVQNWFIQNMTAKIPPVFLNYDGDRLEFYTIEFPLKGSLDEVVDRIEHFSEVIPHEVENTPHAWFWTLEKEYRNEKPLKKQNKEIFVDSKLSNEDGIFYRYKAEIKIQGKILRIDVNSEKRANDMEAFFKTNLGSFLGDARRLKHEQRYASKNDNVSKEPEIDISLEEQTELIQQMLDQHYIEWLDSPLPYLKGKSPRQATKTKKGQQDVINLLKDMQNSDLRSFKRGEKTKLYNFDWLFLELSIDQNHL